MDLKNKLLIVDDEKKILKALTFLLEDDYSIYTSQSSHEALNTFLKEEIYMVLLDLRLSDESGIDLMKRMLAIRPNAVIIIMTAYSSIENSISAIKDGAYYFITKPIDQDQIQVLLKKANEKVSMLEKIHNLEGYVKKDLIGVSKEISNITEIINRVKDTNATILITGESGTGKELIAQKIHRTSNRADQPFVAINCAAMPGELLESELFGYKKGAFTGAYKDEIGLIRRADKGTLLLDEIGEMDLRLQTKLLRFLQEKNVRQVGSTDFKNVDVRIICITNRDLKEEVLKGRFREDLYYRINVINIHIPPLRERKEDLKALVDYFINKYNISFNKNILGISDKAYKILEDYPFNGNIRELENIIQRAVLLSTSNYIEEAFITEDNMDLIRDEKGESSKDYIKIFPDENIKDIEKKVIAFGLENNNHNRKKTAEALGISERSIRYKIKEYDL